MGFSRLIKSNTLHPRPSNRDSEEHITFSVPVGDTETQQVVSSTNLIENTMWFPYYIHSTILCQPQVSQELNQMLAALYRYFTGSTLEPDDITTGLQILQKLYQGSQTNDATYFPGTNTATRTNFYQALWQELVNLSHRSKRFYKDSKSPELSKYIDSLVATSTGSPVGPEPMQVDSSPQQKSLQKPNQPQHTSGLASGSNSGDLTHTGSSLEQERKRRKFAHRPDPFENTDKSSLFSTYWNAKISKIPPKKNVL